MPRKRNSAWKARVQGNTGAVEVSMAECQVDLAVDSKESKDAEAQ